MGFIALLTLSKIKFKSFIYIQSFINMVAFLKKAHGECLRLF